MTEGMQRRHFLGMTGAVGAGLALGPAGAAAAVDGPGARHSIRPPLRMSNPYTDDYTGSWTSLDTGDVLGSHDLSGITWSNVTGENVQQLYDFQSSQTVSNQYLRLTWNATSANKTGTCLWRFKDVDQVTIENVYVENLDPDYITSHVIRVEGADEVIIRNCYFAGPVDRQHIFLEGVANILIENVEIVGLELPGTNGPRAGGGIMINNGATSGSDDGVDTPYAREPVQQTIQHCYIHNSWDDDGNERNQDGILIHSPADGYIFNNVIENWFRNEPSGGPQAHGMDSSIDIGFRRDEPQFQDKNVRVERNILRNTTFFKTPVGTIGPNRILLANNLIINAKLDDYHGGGSSTSHYVHNTMLWDIDLAPISLQSLAQRGATGYCFKLGSFSGPTVLENCVVYTEDSSPDIVYANSSGSAGKWAGWSADHNAYGTSTSSTKWLNSTVDSTVCSTFSSWQSTTGNDANSVTAAPDPNWFEDYLGGDYRLSGSSLWSGVADTSFVNHADPHLRVDRDFNGESRTTSNVRPGAFNYS
ncbi:right-handed parallel beta-helix repeat-containing protein [Ruania alkalisoli]|uniref:Right-handed parallel beta-helix repeat-containing protein n=1 Tax=Ruania alkalisoli TaxID=2779775 RepID=A0A7M1SVS6_9MICO|nr:right-handed parallel beta-helix repeat-containing protein [Ruania alkalisoli]QOR71635.1 right-handed parallel beta-helix repeat-containing protein [Ruania alkalisoli]